VNRIHRGSTRTAEHGISWNGVDWEATITYDVLSTPQRATRDDPEEHLDVDVLSVELTARWDDKARHALVPAVPLPFGNLPPMELDAIEQACIDHWYGMNEEEME